MPELRKIETAAQNVKKNDHVVYGNRDGFVETVKLGDKWISIREADGRLIVRVERDTLIEVERMMPTQAEQDAAQERYMDKAAEKFLEGLEETYPAVIKSMTDNINRGLSVTTNMMEQLVVGEVHMSYAVRLRNGLERHNGEKSLRELITMLKNELEEYFIENNGFARWSGGFTFTNAAEQTQHDTKKAVYRSIKWTF